MMIALIVRLIWIVLIDFIVGLHSSEARAHRRNAAEIEKSTLPAWMTDLIRQLTPSKYQEAKSL
jgi:hypothetical protein